MFKFIKLYKEIKRLKAEHDKLVDEIAELKKKTENPSPEKVIRNILKRDIGWYDYNLLPFDGRIAYYQGAQSLLINETLKNELNHFLADQLKFIGYESMSHEQTMHIRTGIVAIETLMDRLKCIPEPSRNVEMSLEDQSQAI